MQILIPDAQFDDDATIERETLGPAYNVAVHREQRSDRIPDATWRAADAVICFHEVPIGAGVIGQLERCRLIVRAGVGYDQIDTHAAGARGIPVCNVPDYGTAEVADHAIALMLGLARGLISYHQRLIANPSAGWHWSGAPMVRRLRGLTFGIVGLGRIGLATARRAAGHDMHVLFFDPYLPDGAELGVGYDRASTLADLLGHADVLSLHCPLSTETAGLIGPAELAAMKPTAILINTARGALIDLVALEATLKDGKLGGAALDVVPTEPPAPDHTLVQAFRRREPWIDGRLLLTPHAAWFSEDGRRDLRAKSAATVKAFLEHQELRNCVNRAMLLTT